MKVSNLNLEEQAPIFPVQRRAGAQQGLVLASCVVGMPENSAVRFSPTVQTGVHRVAVQC